MNDSPAYRLTDHAREEAARRSIPLAAIEAIVQTPEQIVSGDNNRQVYQSRVTINGTLYLVRVVTEPTQPLTVITVYRTSKIEKYWSNES